MYIFAGEDTAIDKKWCTVIAVVIFAGAMAWGRSDAATAPKQPAYVGTKLCMACHKRRDDSVDVWNRSKHARAYEALAGADAKKFSKDPQHDPKCLVCHTVGFNQPGGFFLKLNDEQQAGLTGVGCEECHGPGSGYVKFMMAAIKGKWEHEKAHDAGLVHPTEETCVKCHNKNSPFYKSFNFDKSLGLIKHGKTK